MFVLVFNLVFGSHSFLNREMGLLSLICLAHHATLQTRSIRGASRIVCDRYCRDFISPAEEDGLDHLLSDGPWLLGAWPSVSVGSLLLWLALISSYGYVPKYRSPYIN